jgi:hypothetical protein
VDERVAFVKVLALSQSQTPNDAAHLSSAEQASALRSIATISAPAALPVLLACECKPRAPRGVVDIGHNEASTRGGAADLSTQQRSVCSSRAVIALPEHGGSGSTCRSSCHKAPFLLHDSGTIRNHDPPSRQACRRCLE